MGSLRKKTVLLVAGIMMTLLMSQLAYADYFQSNGNGATVFYDDGSRVEYNARGSSITFYDPWGGEIDTLYDQQLTESQFKSRYMSSSSSSKSSSSKKSSSNTKYYNAQVDDAYWSYTSGRCTAKWEADYQSSGKYTVTLYRDGHKVSSKSSNGGKSVDFTDAIANGNRTGEYYFTVKGSWSGGYTDTATSDYMYVNDNTLNQIRSRHNSNVSSQSGPGVVTNNAGGPGATPASMAGPGTQSGWQNIGGIWKYLRPNGTYAVNCWELVNNKWYYFDANGNMAANQWVQTDAWYYVGPDGDMQVNQWIQSKADARIWYYVGGDGRMVTNTVINGWPINANGECYFG